MGNDILIVDDEADICKLVQGILEDEGYHTRLAANAQQAREAINEKAPSLVILDIWLQGSDQDGLQLLETIKKDNPHIPVIMISGHGTIETAVSAIKQGAYDFIEKPFKAGRLLLMVGRALETAALKRENEMLRQRAPDPQEMIGDSREMNTLRQMIERIGPTSSNVLLTGEAGAGKDLVARAIHNASLRRDAPYLVLNCATLHPERIEAELFGMEKTANQPGQTGILEQANGGTLLLDEVADMPLETQGKIVRAIQEQRFQRLGGAPFVQVDVRIIASSNRDLEMAMQNGDFRQDLYYRLNVMPVRVPPLREHSSDIGPLCAYFIKTISKQSGLPVKSFSSEALRMLEGYGWPGNVRQLRNIVEWIMIMNSHSEGEKITRSQLPPEISGGKVSPRSANDDSSAAADMSDFVGMPLREAREIFEKQYLSTQIDRFEGNISKTAQFIGMERSALHRKLRSLDIAAIDKNKDTDDRKDEAGKTAARKIA